MATKLAVINRLGAFMTRGKRSVDIAGLLEDMTEWVPGRDQVAGLFSPQPAYRGEGVNEFSGQMQELLKQFGDDPEKLQAAMKNSGIKAPHNMGKFMGGSPLDPGAYGAFDPTSSGDVYSHLQRAMSGRDGGLSPENQQVMLGLLNEQGQPDLSKMWEELGRETSDRPSTAARAATGTIMGAPIVGGAGYGAAKGVQHLRNKKASLLNKFAAAVVGTA